MYSLYALLDVSVKKRPCPPQSVREALEIIQLCVYLERRCHEGCLCRTLSRKPFEETGNVSLPLLWRRIRLLLY